MGDLMIEIEEEIGQDAIDAGVVDFEVVQKIIIDRIMLRKENEKLKEEIKELKGIQKNFKEVGKKLNDLVHGDCWHGSMTSADFETYRIELESE